MRRRLLRLSVLVTLGLFAACATSEDPTTQTVTPTPSLDASADRNVAKDTGGTVVEEDAGEEEEDASVAKDAGKDAKTDTGTTDSGNIDTGTVDAGDANVDDAADDAADANVADADDGSTADANDGSTAADANDGAPVEAGCNDLVYGSPPLPLSAAGGTAPAATGGPVTPGTYNLTSYNYYSSTAPAYTLRSTVRISPGNVIDRLITDASGIEKSQSGTFATVGSTITMTWTCGGVGNDVGQYTAGANKFAFYPANILEAIHTK